MGALNLRNSIFGVGLAFLLSCPYGLSQSIKDQWDYHQKMEEKSIFAGLQWHSVGPSFTGSRVETIETPENNPETLYVGFGSGSLWKSTDSGLHWKNIFENQASFSIGDLAISSQNPEILWLGTGEQLRASRAFSFPGAGVYKSEDGGEHWIHMGLGDSHHIGRILIDPMDSKRIWVAAMGHFWTPNKQRGLFYTEDGGYTWEKILYLSDSVGVSDVVWDFNNEILYASSWQMPDGSGSKVFKSSDLGKTWTQMNLPIEGGSKIGRIGLSYCAGWPQTVYALVDNRNSRSSDQQEQVGAEVFRSDNYGETWRKTPLKYLDNYGGFGWAFGDILVHPRNPEEVYILGVHLMQSMDGGKTFERISGSVKHLEKSRANTLHLDQHDFKIIPGNQDVWILGNDGGIYTSSNRGESWLHLNTIPTGEFYDFSLVDGPEVRVFGGTQDNSNINGIIHPLDFSTQRDQWDYTWLDPWSGGDGFSSYQDPEDSDVIYWESQNGYLNRKNRFTQENKLIMPVPDEDEKPLRNSWFTPFFISKHDASSIYYAANKVYRSIDKGESWFRVSHDLTFTESKEKQSRSITCIAESPIQAGILYAGTEKGALWVSRNEGSKWFEVSDGLPIKKLVALVASRHLNSRIYAVAKGMDDDDRSPYVYSSDDYGRHWTKISIGLPEIPTNCLLEDPVFPNVLYLGTDAGIFCSRDRGNNWISLSTQLPTASISQMRFMGDHQFLLASSHGQGLFYAFIQPVRIFFQSGHPDENKFLSSTKAKLPRAKDYQQDWDYSTRQPLFFSWYSTKSGTCSFSLQDDSQLVVYSREIPLSQGLNQFSWDLILSITEDHTNYPLPEVKFPKAGTYTIVIQIEDQSVSGKVQID